MQFVEKVFVAIFSTLILSLVLAFLQYIPEAEQQAGVGYFSFISSVSLYGIFAFPVYILGGAPYAALVDICIEKMQFRNELLRYILKFVLYLIGGIVIIGLVFIIFNRGFNNHGLKLLNLFVFGALASLLYFHVGIVWKRITGFIPK